MLADDQEWCLECGAARTLIHRAPDWRVPLAIVGAVLLLVLAAFAIALISLTNDANQRVQTRSASAPAAPPQTTPAPPVTRAVAGWPVGLSGWTVVLAQRHKHAKANAIARRLGAHGIDVGILNSSDHPSMKPGYWIVFSGRYPDRVAAASAAATLRAQGHRRAAARRVAPPGGI